MANFINLDGEKAYDGDKIIKVERGINNKTKIFVCTLILDENGARYTIGNSDFPVKMKSSAGFYLDTPINRKRVKSMIGLKK